MKKSKYILFVLLILILFLLSVANFVIAEELSDDTTVPLLGLDQSVHMPIFWFLLPIIGSIITSILFPRIFAPLFLKIKNKIYYRYENGYLEVETAILNKKLFLRRGIYILLLTLGIMAFILPLIDVSYLITIEDMKGYRGDGIEPRYALPTLMGVQGLILPIIVGLWAIGWSMEDAGLMHYRLEDDRPGKLYEIEPIHIKYSSYLKGYAGLSAILFIVGVSIYFTQLENRMEDAILALTLPFSSILFSIPAYFLYAKVNGKNIYLRKNLPEIKKISKDQILKE